LNLVEFDIGIIGTVDRGSGHPPLCAGEAGRQVSPAPRSIAVLRVSGLGEDDPVSWLPQPDGPVDSFQDDGVEPAPDDDIGDVCCGRDGKQVTRSYPLSARRREGPRVRNRFRPAAGEHSARVLGRPQNDRGPQSYGRFSVRRFGHPTTLPKLTPEDSRDTAAGGST